MGLAPAAGAVAWLAAGAIGFAIGGPVSGPVCGFIALGAALALARRRTVPTSVGLIAGLALAACLLHLPAQPGSVLGSMPPVVMGALLVGLGVIHAKGRGARILRLSCLGLGALVVVAGALGARQVWVARDAFTLGIHSSQNGINEVRGNNPSAAVASFERSGRAFSRARDLLSSGLAIPGRWVPLLGIQMHALSDAGAAGGDLASAGARVVAANNLDGLRLVDGEMPMAAIEGMAPSLERATHALEQSLDRIAAIRSPWLLTPIDKRLDQAVDKVERAQTEAEHALVAAKLLPPMLGSDGPRRYFLALVTPGEARGSGGLIGNYAIITVDGKRMDMPIQGRDGDLQTATPEESRTLTQPADFIAHYGRFEPAQTWANVTMSPDFPTTTQLVAQLYPQSGGEPIDGVISLDPIGLSALLKVIGPVTVPEWPEPITADNVVRVLLIDQYVRYEDLDERRKLLEEVTKEAFDRFSNAKFTSPKALIDAMAPAVAGRHLMVGSLHQKEMAGLEKLGLAGRMPPVDGDALTVVTQNGSGNKIDYFLHRDIDYRAKIDPATGAIAATLEVTLRNDAPSSGLPDYIIGNPFEPPLPMGTSSLYVSVYTPWTLVEGKVAGEKQVFDVNEELGRYAYSRFIQIPPGSAVTFTLELQGKGDFASRYNLDIFHTTQVNPDRVTASVDLPPGWVAAPRTGGKMLRPGVTETTDADGGVTLRWTQRPLSGE